MNPRKLILLSVLLAASYPGCGPNDSAPSVDDGSAASDASASAISGAVSAGDDQGAFALNDGTKSSLLAKLGQWAMPSADAAACGAFTCADSTTLTSGPMNACSFGLSSATWTGEFRFQVFGGPSCACNATSFFSLGSGCGFVRTFKGLVGGATPYSAVRSNGPVNIYLNSTTATGYANPVSGGTKVTCGAGGCAQQRTIEIDGYSAYGTVNGKVAFWHTVSTLPANPLEVEGKGETRTVRSGTLIVQHNGAHYSATSQVTEPLVHSANCCFPTGGSITTSFEGGQSLEGKSVGLTFTSNCGVAQFRKVDGSTREITLSACF